MISRGRLGRCLIGVLFLTGASIRAQEAPARLPAYRARLLGVFDANTGEPIEGAQVADVLSKMSSLTTKTGTVSLIFLPDSGSIIRVQKVGYQPATMVVKISPEDTLPITMLLNAIVTTLPTVVTKDTGSRHLSPGLRDMEERRRQGFGYFITEAELRKNDSKRMTNVIRTLPNVNMVCPQPEKPRNGECWAASGRMPAKNALRGGSCALDVYINGAISPDNDLEKLAVSEFAGVEMYLGGASIPTMYNKTGSSCGVLLLWYRDR
jgi:hypothetical protein